MSHFIYIFYLLPRLYLLKCTRFPKLFKLFFGHKCSIQFLLFKPSIYVRIFVIGINKASLCSRINVKSNANKIIVFKLQFLGDCISLIGKIVEPRRPL